MKPFPERFKRILVIIILVGVQFGIVPLLSHEGGKKIEFPDIPGYQTLKCDLHIHTVFSDGEVWPTIRVKEALSEGLDAISITDHLEYQPHSQDIPHPDRNRSYEIAKNAANGTGLIVTMGAEITRDMPPGHANAIFLQDVNPLLTDDPIDVFREAKRQGAFIFWNHPNWVAQQPNGVAQLTDVHRELIREGLLNGIEVVNEVTYSDEALQIGLDNNLAIMGTSDIHGLVDWLFELNEGGHRPITLVFATEKSEAGMKEALEAGRTAVWFDNNLIGKSECVTPLIQSSLVVRGTRTVKHHEGEDLVVAVELENNSTADFVIENSSAFTLHSHTSLVRIDAKSTETIEVKILKSRENFSLQFEVLNAFVAPGKHPFVTVDVNLKE